VRAAFAHRQPDRVPFSWNFGPVPELHQVLARELGERGISWRRLWRTVEDIRTVSPRYCGPELPKLVDVWGIRRKYVSYGGGGYLEFEHHPLAGVEDPRVIEAHPWPDPDLYTYAETAERFRRADPDGRVAKKLCVTVCGNPFETYCWMTGLEEAMINLVANPELVHLALDGICTFFEGKMRRAVECCGDEVDLFYFGDDLGGQKRLLFSREHYRSVVQPSHRRLVAFAKSLVPGAKTMLHTDGAVFEILPDVVEAGFDAQDAVQVDARGMDPAALKQRYGDELVFHGGISVQALLPSEDAETVERTCRELVETFGKGGGYVAVPTHAIQLGTPTDNVLAMLRGVLGEADYTSALEAAVT